MQVCYDFVRDNAEWQFDKRKNIFLKRRIIYQTRAKDSISIKKKIDPTWQLIYLVFIPIGETTPMSRERKGETILEIENVSSRRQNNFNAHFLKYTFKKKINAWM